MNNEIPPPQSDPPSFGLMFFLGVMLVFVAAFLCGLMRGIAPFFLCAIGAFITAFFPGYRGVAAGFYAVIGVVFLGLMIVCGPMMLHH